ncbi:MAG: hypothetical protein CXZ00_16340 [Acidobacteria bacterium]|nr:MAG: hypothetical protein CXZ00_16340 [Acidobacteriota bacterium]
MNEETQNAPGVTAEGVSRKGWVKKFSLLNNGNPWVCQDVFEWLWRNSDRFVPHNAKWYLCKIEREKAPWHHVQYDQSRIAVDAATIGAMYFSILGFEQEPLPATDPRNLNIVRHGHWHLDFDAQQEDITPALLDLRKLLFELLPSYGVNPNVVPVYYSGGKGFHATVFNTILGTQDGSNILPHIYKEMAAEFGKKLKTLDQGIYKTGLGQLYRIPNISRKLKGGVHKIPLQLSEVQEGGLTLEEIKTKAMKPRLIDLPAVPKSEVKQ